MAGTNNALNNSSSTFQVGNLNLASNTLSSTNTNGNIVLGPNGTGSVVPSANNTKTLGANALNWNNIYATGITFDNNSNNLSSYVSGTFTPTLVGGTVAGTTTYLAQVGAYVKVGGMVTVGIHLQISAATGTGDVAIGGIPYAPYANIMATGAAYLQAPSFTFPASRPYLTVAWINGNCRLSAQGTGQNPSNLQMTNAALEVYFTLTFPSF